MAKKCSTDQRFIRKRNTTYKIHILAAYCANIYTVHKVKTLKQVHQNAITRKISRFFFHAHKTRSKSQTIGLEFQKLRAIHINRKIQESLNLSTLTIYCNDVPVSKNLWDQALISNFNLPTFRYTMYKLQLFTYNISSASITQHLTLELEVICSIPGQGTFFL